jgi:bifunctional DNA-binding transcriptional regulator/antitoxin component of YhaV-PrlF toxin-antitoxin module
MKETEILRIDERGRLLIPIVMRKSLNLVENSNLLATCDVENGEIRLTPLQFSEQQNLIKIRILMEDKTGALAQLAKAFAEKQISLVHDESIILKKGLYAEWTVTIPIPTIPLEELIEHLKSTGCARNITVLEK